ncbi:OLC1v1020741C2 [Oldenlandia corymbosa var. corymbosa]|uniref:OLC1v1020741C2 n=1 Tax=Oldenlandia corymbosa var. corymbosa TaxID=529605 RepID=A0AAV1BU33_OLDCO|nr:OLC1v1020741C2 [Oldenlandia corymbosa var. corymbosa]
MKKSASAGGGGGLAVLPLRNVFWFSWKLLTGLSIVLCILAFLRLYNYAQTFPSTASSESELLDSGPTFPVLSSSSSPLLHHRSRFVNSYAGFKGNSKIAFLFLARKNLPLDFLWGSFFEDADVANFSIYVHSEPGFAFDESTTKSAFFYDRQLRNSIKVAWGESSMIEAERLLFEAALQDPANQRFILLSESCVPLYNFSYVYNYLLASPKSFVDSFLDKKEGRYNEQMAPVIPKKKWRKGSQWITLVRKHAEVIVDDDIIFPVFQKFCKRRPLLDPSKGKQNLKLQKQHNCIPDEHYVQTLLAMKDLEDEIERRPVTYTLWNQSKSKMEMSGWHPITFSYADAGPQQIKRIKGINHVYYETEFRTEWCKVNSTSVPCFLFARKFSEGAAMRLLIEGVVSKLNTTKLLE